MEKHVIPAPTGRKARCVHGRYDSPHGYLVSGQPGELHRCPKCLKWWRCGNSPSGLLWYRVGFWDFKDRRRIKEFETRERNQMHTIVGSDKIVEDN